MRKRHPDLVAPGAATVSSATLDEARRLIMRHGWNATAYQLLNPGISLWFSARRDAVVGYVRHGGTRVVAGAPVCDAERLTQVVDEFRLDAAIAGQRVCFFGAGERLEGVLAASGDWSVASLGAQPSWDPTRWESIVARRSSLRAQLNRARNKGVRAEIWHAAADDGLRRCLAEWLEKRPLPPLHFLIEPDTLGRLEDRRVFAAYRDDRIVGFLLASPVPARRGWLVEQIIRGRDAPNGTAELLLDSAMRTLASDGARYVTLGLAPLSAHSHFQATRMPLWLRAGLRWVRAHGRRFYNFEGLDRFKAKFEPDAWEEIVALADSPHFPPRAMWAIAGAFAQSSPILLVARALARAAEQETRWAAGAFRSRLHRP